MSDTTPIAWRYDYAANDGDLVVGLFSDKDPSGKPWHFHITPLYAAPPEAAARIAALEAEVAKLEVSLMDLAASGAHRIASVEAALATARADALEEAARVAGAYDTGDYAVTWRDAKQEIAAAIRALALTQSASTQPLTDQGETSTAGEVG